MRITVSLFLLFSCLFSSLLATDIRVEEVATTIYEKQVNGFQLTLKQNEDRIQQHIQARFQQFEDFEFESMLIYENIEYPDIVSTHPITLYFLTEEVQGVMTNVTVVAMYDYQQSIHTGNFPDLSLRLLLEIKETFQPLSTQTISFDHLFRETELELVSKSFENRKEQFQSEFFLEFSAKEVEDDPSVLMKQTPDREFTPKSFEQEEDVVQKFMQRFDQYMRDNDAPDSPFKGNDEYAVVQQYEDSITILKEELAILEGKAAKAAMVDSLKDALRKQQIIAIEAGRRAHDQRALADQQIENMELKLQIERMRYDSLSNASSQNPTLKIEPSTTPSIVQSKNIDAKLAARIDSLENALAEQQRIARMNAENAEKQQQIALDQQQIALEQQKIALQESQKAREMMTQVQQENENLRRDKMRTDSLMVVLLQANGETEEVVNSIVPSNNRAIMAKVDSLENALIEQQQIVQAKEEEVMQQQEVALKQQRIAMEEVEETRATLAEIEEENAQLKAEKAEADSMIAVLQAAPAQVEDNPELLAKIEKLETELDEARSINIEPNQPSKEANLLAMVDSLQNELSQTKNAEPLIEYQESPELLARLDYLEDALKAAQTDSQSTSIRDNPELLARIDSLENALATASDKPSELEAKIEYQESPELLARVDSLEKVLATASAKPSELETKIEYQESPELLARVDSLENALATASTKPAEVETKIEYRDNPELVAEIDELKAKLSQARLPQAENAEQVDLQKMQIDLAGLQAANTRLQSENTKLDSLLTVSINAPTAENVNLPTEKREVFVVYDSLRKSIIQQERLNAQYQREIEAQKQAVIDEQKMAELAADKAQEAMDRIKGENEKILAEFAKVEEAEAKYEQEIADLNKQLEAAKEAQANQPTAEIANAEPEASDNSQYLAEIEALKTELSQQKQLLAAAQSAQPKSVDTPAANPNPSNAETNPDAGVEARKAQLTQQALKQLQVENDQLQKDLSKLKTENENQTSQLEAAAETQAQLQQMRKRADSLQTAYARVVSEKEELVKTSEAQASAGEQSLKSQIYSMETEREELRKQKAAVEKRANALNTEVERLSASLNQAKQEAQESQRIATQTKADAQAKQQNLQKELTAAEKQLDRLTLTVAALDPESEEAKIKIKLYNELWEKLYAKEDELKEDEKQLTEMQKLVQQQRNYLTEEGSPGIDLEYLFGHLAELEAENKTLQGMLQQEEDESRIEGGYVAIGNKMIPGYSFHPDTQPESVIEKIENYFKTQGVSAKVNTFDYLSFPLSPIPEITTQNVQIECKLFNNVKGVLVVSVIGRMADGSYINPWQFPQTSNRFKTWIADVFQ